MHNTPTRSHWAVYVAPLVVTAVLGAAMTLSVMQSIVRSNWTNDGLQVLVPITLGGLVVGGIFSAYAGYRVPSHTSWQVYWVSPGWFHASAPAGR
jgi:hypothetical protein